jgi:hypothetical protein
MHAFIDESWLMLPSEDKYFLAVASVMTDERRKLLLMSRRLKRSPKLKAHSELKASASSSKTATKLLQMLANQADVSIVAAISQGRYSEIDDFEELYQDVVARCALQTVRRHPRIDLIIDKRYTNLDQQRAFEGIIREAIAVVPNNIVRIFQEESHATPELAAADFVAWALMARYGRGEGQFYNIIRPKIEHFDDLSRQK